MNISKDYKDNELSASIVELWKRVHSLSRRALDDNFKKDHYDLSKGNYAYRELMLTLKNIKETHDSIDEDLNLCKTNKLGIPFLVTKVYLDRELNKPLAKLVFKSPAGCIMVTTVSEAKDLGYNPKNPKHDLYDGYRCSECGSYYSEKELADQCSSSDRR